MCRYTARRAVRVDRAPQEASCRSFTTRPSPRRFGARPGSPTDGRPSRTCSRASPRSTRSPSCPAGTPVWIRADLDVADRDGDHRRRPATREPARDARVRSGTRLADAAHRPPGPRRPRQTLEYVYQKLKATEPGCGPFIRDWFDERAETLTGTAVKAVEGLKPGQFLVFENVPPLRLRDAALERARRDSSPRSPTTSSASPRAFRQGATVYVNDAIASGNKDFSTTALPAGHGPQSRWACSPAASWPSTWCARAKPGSCRSRA